jgi:enterochelin esterase-like enzyme
MEATLVTVLAALIAVFVLWTRRQRHKLLDTIEIVTLSDVEAEFLGSRRDVFVYLPPDYRSDIESRYPVLYINDGQDREALRLRETLARLMNAGRIDPILVVAIPTNKMRLEEYGTTVAPNAQGQGSLAWAYAHFVAENLMPRIDVEFRTLPGASILGMSLGGLSAFDVAWNYPESFSAVGIMSGSFWWRASEDEVRIEPGSRIVHSLVRQATEPPPYRMWFEAGRRDEVSDRDGNGVIDAIQDTTELIDELLAIGCDRNDLAYVELPGGRHDHETWSAVLPDFLTWAFSPERHRQRTRLLTASRQPR